MPATLLVPGTPSSAAAWNAALAPHGLALENVGASVEVVANDGHFGDAFRLPTVTEAQRRAIANVGSALVIAIEEPLQTVATALAQLVATLARAGALGVRIEQSKLGYPIAEWVTLVGSGDPWALYRATVVVLTDRGKLASCGMHVFGLPDAEVSADAARGNALLGAFNVFQLAEDPVLRSGETFAPDAETPRRVLDRRPDVRYPSSHPCHNPFGVWAFGPEGGKGRALPQNDVVFMPALAALLAAAEKHKGAPLTEAEVEAIRDKASCMTVSPRHAQALERSRGYADLDPERAFAQWQLLRAR
jgi:hypothetical protein